MIGTTVSHYRILEKLGAGGMGVVYRAEDTRLKRTVALKFLPPDLTRNEEARTRFIHEAQAASALEHTNICSIHEIGEHEGRTFIVMGYYEGDTLKLRIANGQFLIDEALEIAVQVARGLAKAHEAGIVHRDIKPANIVVMKDGTAKILDFGLAKVSGQTLMTKTGSTLGTAAYMSPEQARGEPVDHRTDIWSLGVMLYEMLTGQRPFASEYEQALTYAILNEDPKPLRQLRPEVPEAIEKICVRAISKSSKDRYQTAAELIADLEAYKAGSQISGKTQKIPLKRRTVLYAVSVAAVLILAGIGVFTSIGRGEVFDRVAVLPFLNISKDSTQESIAFGMTEEVIARLQQIASLNVPTIRSTMKFKGSQASYGEIAGELGAKALVEASVQCVNNRVRVTARLIDPEKDRTIWTDTFDGNMEEVLDLQSRIARAVVDKVRADVSAEEQMRISKPARKVDPQAYELYLSARQDFNAFSSSLSRSLWDGMMAKLQRAIALEPENGAYQASLAYGYHFAIDASVVPFSEAFPRALHAVDKALALDPEGAETQMVAALLDRYRYDFVSALARANRAVELSPGNPKALHARGAVLLTVGRFEEALEIYRRMNEIDPIEYRARGFRVGMTYFFMRRYDDAISFLQEWLRQNPQSEFGHAYLSCAYSMKGMHADALAHCDSAPHYGSMNRSLFLARAGQRDRALKEFERNRENINDYTKGQFFVAIGLTDSAFFWFNRFYKEPTGELGWFEHDPFLDRVRDDPRYKELLRKMNLLM